MSAYQRGLRFGLAIGMAAFAALALIAFIAVINPVKAEPLNWTGAYVGAHAGYGWGDSSTVDTTGGVPAGPFTFSPAGGFGGGTAGFNQQFGRMVLGVEADLGYMNLGNAGYVPSSNPAYHQDVSFDAGLYGLAAGRVGVALGDLLIYGKGGWAYFDGAAGQTTTKPGYVTNKSSALTGWAYGGGFERALGKGWSLKLEYLRFDFGTADASQTSIGDDPIGYVYRNETDLTVDTVKVGVNYRFNTPELTLPAFGPLK